MPRRPWMTPPGGEVRPLDAVPDDVAGLLVLHVVHEVGQLDVRILDDADDRVEHLGRVVRRQARRHADGDAERAVDEQVGELARQDGRLHEPVVVVGLEVDGAKLEIVEHVDRGLRHAGLGVSHGRGRIALDGSEVALGLDQRHAHTPVLREADEGGVDDALAVRVVVAGGVAGDLGALEVLLGRPELEVVHRLEDATL